MPKAEQAALKALELDDMLSEAHVILGDVKRVYYWDAAGAEREYQLALELDPGSYEAPYQYAFFLTSMGRHDESVAMGRRAQQLNPLDPNMRSGACARFRFAARYEEALEQCQAALEMDPDFQSSYRDLGDIYENLGLYNEAAAARQKEWTLAGVSEDELTGLAEAAALGKERYYRWMLDYWEKRSERRHVSPDTFAKIYAFLGDKDQAFKWLEEAYEEHDLVLNIKVNPDWDPLRDDPRFQDLLRRMNLLP